VNDHLRGLLPGLEEDACAVIAVMLVPCLSGIRWGWQMRRGRTVLWAMAQHSLIWVIGLQFAFPA
jgi:hypothetical protein